jgi:hypothetical protein
MSIYELMKNDWKTYCLMSSIIFIEEMSKPQEHIQIKKYKDKIYKCMCYSPILLRMKDKEFLDKFFETTKIWEVRLKKGFLGPSFTTVKQAKNKGQYFILLTPSWLSSIIAECGRIPNKYSFERSLKRINSIKQKRNEKLFINKNKFLFKELFTNKILAAGAFIISFDLEFRGIQQGRPSLAMSDNFKDFLEFMLKVAKKWNWTKNKNLSSVNMDYKRSLGINASPQFEFRLSILGLRKIYGIAGPLVIKSKDKCISFHTERSKNYVNKGDSVLRKGETKKKIFEFIKKNQNATSSQIQFTAGVGVDVILDHLHKLESEGLIKKIRGGKRYLWNIT